MPSAYIHPRVPLRAVGKMRVSRRTVLRSTTAGFGWLAFQALAAQQAMGQEGGSATAGSLQLPSLKHRQRVKRVIFMCMSGGPAHLDTFDYKPQQGKKPHAGSAFRFSQHGESGLWVSELMPHTARHADRLCVLNGMYCDTGNHAQSFLQMHTGERLRPRPSLGSWIVYGLGSENENLPGFISLNAAKPSVYSSAFLPTTFSGTPIGTNGEDMSLASIENISSSHLLRSAKRDQLNWVTSMNQQFAASQADQRLEGAMESMELAFRMQSAAPDLLDLGQETQATLDRYRVGKKLSVGTCRPTDFGRQCLLARKFIEAGVRFVEIQHGGWDQHKNHRRDLRANCETVDAPIAALLEDLATRGLLDDTLLVWGGEFGRPGLTPGNDKDETGHNYRGFTYWLAGGGVKNGIAHGATDETGARAVAGKMHFRDLHATIFHLLGLDANTLTFFHAGREHRITGPETGNVEHAILA